MTSSKPSALKRGAYRLRFEADAWEEWKALDGASKAALRQALIKRLDNPHVPASMLKVPLAGCYKIKLQKLGYRLVYEVLDDVVVVLVLAVGRRANSAAYTVATERLAGQGRTSLVKMLRPRPTQ